MSKSSEPAWSKTSQAEKVEDPTLSQRYLIYSHVPLKLITHLQVQVLLLYCLHLQIKGMLYLASLSDATALQVERHNQKEREGNKT